MASRDSSWCSNVCAVRLRMMLHRTTGTALSQVHKAIHLPVPSPCLLLHWGGVVDRSLPCLCPHGHDSINCSAWYAAFTSNNNHNYKGIGPWQYCWYSCAPVRAYVCMAMLRAFPHPVWLGADQQSTTPNWPKKKPNPTYNFDIALKIIVK
jgi:hypothetical protein